MSKSTHTRTLHLTAVMQVFLCVTAPAVLLGTSQLAVAQETATGQKDAKDNSLDEVVVTGSRVARSTFTTPNPVTTLDSKDIEDLGLVNVGEVLAELPQNSNFFSAANVGLGNFNVGAQLANLRGLNPFFGTRTLTLIDTERVVPTATGGGVDVTLIPSMLVAKTEVVTGGASAVYGSDAVAGVVNIILDHKLDGFKGQADYGQTSHHDGGTSHFSMAYGSDLADGRLHFIVGGEYQNSEDIGLCSQVRDWCKNGAALYTNTQFAGTPAGGGAPAVPANGIPHYVIGPNATLANQSLTGVLTPCNISVPVCIPFGPQYNLNSAGTAGTPFNPGTYADGAGVFGYSQGADAPGAYDATTLRPAVKRYTGLGNIDFKINDNLNSFLQFSFARSEAVNPVANGSIGPIALEVAKGVFVPLSSAIAADNAYLPAQFQAGGATALPAGGALLGYDVNNIDAARNETSNNTVRVTGGLSGTITSTWSWDSYFEFGQNKNNQALSNNVIGSYLQFALDAVTDPATGQVVCRATLPGPTFNAAAAGCQPLNFFGTHNASPAGLAYAFRTLREYSTLKQKVVSGNVHGDVFDGFGAGSVKASFGLEARQDTAAVTHDLQDQPYYNQYFLGYGLDYAGVISVLEGYGEINVPVFKDLPFAKYLEFDGAIRETDNKNKNETTLSSTDGESITHNIPSWKLSTIWDVTDWFRVRATRSRDVRAAGFRELYENYAMAAGGPFGTIVNPITQQSQVVTALTGGNINLEPEKADTTTIGIVIAPKEGPLQRFQFSADWYRIILHDPITGPPFGLGVQNVVNLCHEGQAAFCDRITFGVPGDYSTITAVNNTAVNLGALEQRGVDFEAIYLLPLTDLSNSLNGNLKFRLLTSWLYDMTVDDGLGSPPVDYAGQTGPTGAFGGFNTSPRWQGNFFTTYDYGPFTATAQIKYIGHGSFEAESAAGGVAVDPRSATYSTTNPNSINDNRVASATYLNLSSTFAVNKNLSVFATIDNVLNKDPPVAPGGNGYPTNPVYFDTFGMTWKVGVRGKF